MSSATPSSPAPPNWFQALDAWRGLAAFGVAVYHASPHWAGYAMVDFFLVLSGFVLSHAFLYGRRPIPRSEFVVHRIARLYPLHLFTLVVYIGVLLVSRGGVLPEYPDGNWNTLVQNLLLLHNVGLNPLALNWNFPSWSISVEFWISVAFCLLITRRTPSWLLLAASVLGFGILWHETGHLDVNQGNYFGWLNSGLLRGWSAFLLGILTYRAWFATRDSARARTVAGWTEPLLVLAVVVLLFVPPALQSPRDFVGPPLFVALVYVFAFDAGPIARALRRLQWLGTISYSVYLNQIAVHIVITSIGHRLGLASPLVVALYLGGLLAWSALTYRWIEVPGRRWVRARWLACRGPGGGQASAFTQPGWPAQPPATTPIARRASPARARR